MGAVMLTIMMIHIIFLYCVLLSRSAWVLNWGFIKVTNSYHRLLKEIGTPEIDSAYKGFILNVNDVAWGMGQSYEHVGSNCLQEAMKLIVQ